jgi:hypothetical protein
VSRQEDKANAIKEDDLKKWVRTGICLSFFILPPSAFILGFLFAERGDPKVGFWARIQTSDVGHPRGVAGRARGQMNMRTNLLLLT